MWYVVSEYILDAWFPHRFERQRFPSVHTGVNCCCTKAKDRDTTCNTHRIQFHNFSKCHQCVGEGEQADSQGNHPDALVYRIALPGLYVGLILMMDRAQRYSSVSSFSLSIFRSSECNCQNRAPYELSLSQQWRPQYPWQHPPSGPSRRVREWRGYSPPSAAPDADAVLLRGCTYRVPNGEAIQLNPTRQQLTLLPFFPEVLYSSTML